METFNFDNLRKDIIQASKEAFLELTQHYPEQDFCAFALYTDDGAMTVCPALSTRQFLKQMLQEEPDEYLFYKYATSEWPYEGVGADDKFEEICTVVREEVFRLEDDDTAFKKFKDTLIETCVQALEELRKDFFASKGEDFLLLFAISDGDESKKIQNKRMTRLNSSKIITEFKTWSDTW